MKLSDSPIFRQCGIAEETLVHVICTCESLASLKHSYLCPFYLDPEDVRKLNIRSSGTLLKEQGFSNLVIEHGAQRACPKT